MIYKRKWMALVVLLLILVVTVTAYSQDTVPTRPAPQPRITVIPADVQIDTYINVGDTVRGTLTDETPFARYAFNGEAGDRVTIVLSSEDFDSFVILRDARGIELTNDDDSAGRLNARILDYVLPETGLYTIEVTSTRHRADPRLSAAGDYQMRLTSRKAAVVQAAVTPTAQHLQQPGSKLLTYGSTVIGELAEGQRTSEYTFTGQAGDVVTITLTSENFDTYLVLEDASRIDVAEDDDSARNFDAQIKSFVLPRSGTYTIVVTSSLARSGGGMFATGPYTLTLTSEGTAPVPATSTALPVQVTGGTMNIGDTVSGQLNGDAPSAAYTFTGQAGGVVTITLTSDDFDSFVMLQDMNGAEIASDDDSAGDLNARISGFTLPETGMYTITATSKRHYDNPQLFASGGYTLMLASGEVVTDGDVVTQQGGSIVIGETVTGELTRNMLSATYFLEGEAGQSISILLTSSDFDAYLILRGPDGQEEAHDDDSGGSLNARIGAYVLPKTGRYTVLVSSLGGDETGSYHLSVSSVIVRPIEYTQTVKGELTDENPAVSYRFRGQAGDMVVIYMESDGFDAYLSLSQIVLQSNPLMTNDGSGNTAAIGPFELPETGDYVVTATSYYGIQEGNFTLSLDKVELQRLDHGDTLEVETGGGTSRLYFGFEGTADEAVDIAVESDGRVDTRLTVIDTYGYEIASDDDSGRGSDPKITRLILTDDGMYYVILQARADSPLAKVRLSFALSDLPSLDDGPQKIDLSEDKSQDVVTFTGVQGQRVRLTVLADADSYSEPYITVRQNGETVAYGNASYVTSFSMEFIVPANGRVNVVIEDYSYYAVTFEIRLERLPITQNQ